MAKVTKAASTLHLGGSSLWGDPETAAPAEQGSTPLSPTQNTAERPRLRALLQTPRCASREIQGGGTSDEERRPRCSRHGGQGKFLRILPLSLAFPQWEDTRRERRASAEQATCGAGDSSVPASQPERPGAPGGLGRLPPPSSSFQLRSGCHGS